MSNGAGKGPGRRPTLISNEEDTLRWDYFQGKLKISEKELERRVAKIRKKKKLVR